MPGARRHTARRRVDVDGYRVRVYGVFCFVFDSHAGGASYHVAQPAFYPKESLRHASQSVRRLDEGNPVVLWFEPFIWEWPGNGANPVSAECRISLKLTQQLEKTGYLCRLRK